MTYNEALDFIHSVGWRGSKPGLSRTKELLEKLGSPERELKFIHIAGTNGKGSIAAMLDSICRAAGLKSGLYTSPYIGRFNERMRLCGEPISDDELAALCEMVRPIAEAMDDPPTEFEIITALAFEWYRAKRADIVVLEVGLGGELDSTNVIPAPEAAVITDIALDHTELLGDTIEKIAAAKAGIIKRGCAVACAANDALAEAVIAQKCLDMGCELAEVERGALIIKDETLEGTRFAYKDLKDLFIPLLGDYQPRNAALAVEAARLLEKRGLPLGERAIREGLSAVSWPARFELLQSDPVFIVDGGHNPQGVAAAAASLKKLLPGVRPAVMFGVMADKAVDEMVELLCALADDFICVKPDNPRALDAAALAGKFRSRGKRASTCESVAEGVEKTLALAQKSGAALALGSLYMSGAIRARFGRY